MSENFVIDPNSVVPSQVRADVEAFIQSLPDAAQWSLFFDSTTGQTITDIIAGLATYYKYNNAVGRRESYIHLAKNRSSVVAGAQRNGYSADRGSNTRLKLTITPAGSGIWAKYDILGNVKDRDLIVAEETVYNAGVPVEVEVIVGTINEQTLIADTDRLNSFRFNVPGVSQDLRIYINGVEVPTSSDVLDLLDGYFVCQSNSKGSVDAMYLNSASFATKYVIGSQIKLEWIDLKNISFTENNVSVDAAEGTLTDVEFTELYTAPEEISSIQVNAPVANETGKVVKAREDQAKILPTLDPTIIDSKGKDYSAAVMQLFYLRSGLLLFDETEKEELVELFEKFRPFGIAEPIISDPTRIPVNFDILLVLANSSGNPISDSQAITQAYANKLQVEFNLYDIEAEIEALDNIKVARINYTGPTWAASTQYEFGTIVKSTAVSDDYVYQLEEILYRSGSSEPTWPTTDGDTVVDNQIKWEAVEQAPDAEPAWSANEAYRVGDYVKPIVPGSFVYKAVELLNYSDSTEPVWPPLAGGTVEDMEGTLVYDKNIVWIATALSGSPADWSADTAYKKGDKVVATDPGGSDVVGVMYQVYAYRGLSNSSEPTWPVIEGNVVTDKDLVWKVTDPRRVTYTLDASQYATISETYTVEG